MSLSEEDKTHNQRLSLSPMSKFLDELAISDGMFFLVLQWIFLNLFPSFFWSPPYGDFTLLYSPPLFNLTVYLSII